MKYRIYIMTFAVLALAGCQKKYQYVESVIEKSVLGGIKESTEDPETIKAKNDTMAYIAAYRKFCISQAVYMKMVKDGFSEYLNVPMGFKLYNSDGNDISDIYFVTKEEQEKLIASVFLDSKDDSYSGVEETVVPEIDSAKIKDLLPYFRVKNDEFDPNGATWYEPKSAPAYVNRNGIYLYFKADKYGVGPLRFRVQYYAEDWLFFKRIQFSIDGSAYEYVPSNTETDNGGGNIWEWSDEALGNTDKDLIYALSNAQNAKMKLIGRQYHNIKTISKQQIIDIKRTLDLYHAMGGVY